MKRISIVVVVIGTIMFLSRTEIVAEMTNFHAIASSSLPQRILFIRQSDFRQNLLTERQLQDLIQNKRCMVAFRAIKLRDGKQQIIDVSVPKKVTQVLREAGMGKVVTQIRILKKYLIMQSDRVQGLQPSGIGELIVEPGDVLIDTPYVSEGAEYH
jgi:hypothetical protein